MANGGLVAGARKGGGGRCAERRGSCMCWCGEGGGLSGGTTAGGDEVLVYDTDGFTVELTADSARERGLSGDMAGFDAAMEDQRESARAAGKVASSGGL